MKKLLLTAAFCFVGSGAWAQCTGVFPANTLCGNLTGSPQPPAAFSANTSIFGPGATTTTSGLALWANTQGTKLGDGATPSAQPISGYYQWAGNFGFGTAPVSASILDILGPNQSQTQGFLINQIGTNATSATASQFFWNFIQIANDNTNYTPTNAHDTGLEIQMTVGANAGGSHYGIESEVIQNQTPANPSGDYIGGSFGVIGQNTNPGGSMYGSQNFVQAQLNSLNYFISSGAEFDNIITGVSTFVQNRFGIDIGGTSPTQGTSRDAMIELAGGATGLHWKTGILLSNLHGGPPLDPNVGCIICGDGGAQQIFNGIDLTTVTVSGSVIKANGSFISGTGSAGFQTIQIGTGPSYVLAIGDIGMAKITSSPVGPGAGALKLEVTAGTSAGTCKLIAFAGTSSLATTVVDNVGSGC